MENMYTFASDNERITVDVILSGKFKLIRRPETNRIAIFATKLGEVVYSFHSKILGNGNFAGIVIVRCTQDIPRWSGWRIGFCGEEWINSRDTTNSSVAFVELCIFDVDTLNVIMSEPCINTTIQNDVYR